jgi:hypothetical protein
MIIFYGRLGRTLGNAGQADWPFALIGVCPKQTILMAPNTGLIGKLNKLPGTCLAIIFEDVSQFAHQTFRDRSTFKHLKRTLRVAWFSVMMLSRILDLQPFRWAAAQFA